MSKIAFSTKIVAFFALNKMRYLGDKNTTFTKKLDYATYYKEDGILEFTFKDGSTAGYLANQNMRVKENLPEFFKNPYGEARSAKSNELDL
jgi:hypothetical protein